MNVFTRGDRPGLGIRVPSFKEAIECNWLVSYFDVILNIE